MLAVILVKDDLLPLLDSHLAQEWFVLPIVLPKKQEFRKVATISEEFFHTETLSIKHVYENIVRYCPQAVYHDQEYCNDPWENAFWLEPHVRGAW